MTRTSSSLSNMERTGPPFSPPSRSKPEKKNKHVPPELRRLAVWVAVSSMVQGLIWAVLSAVTIAVYDGAIDAPRWQNGTVGEEYSTLLANLYFMKDGDSGTNLPSNGLVHPSDMNIIMIIFTAANALWFLVSAAVLTAVRRSNASVGFFWLFCWMFCCAVVIVLDVVLAALMVRDLVQLFNWDGLESFPGGQSNLLMCPSTVLIYALRAGVLFVLNAVLLLRVARTTVRLREEVRKAAQLGYRPSVVDREGPIDAYFYGSSVLPGENGTLNPVFVPDEDVNWMTFKAPPLGDRDGPEPAAPLPRAVTGLKQRHYQRPNSVDDGEDVSHLSWMADVDKYIDGSDSVNNVDTENHVSVRELRKKLQEQRVFGSREADELSPRRSNHEGIPRARLLLQQQQQQQRPQVLNQRPYGHNGHYQGPQGHYQGPQGHYQGPQGHYQGPQGHYQGPQGHYQGPQGHYQGPQGHYQGPQGHYQGPQGHYQGPDGQYQGRQPGHYQGPQRRPQIEPPNVPPPDYTPPTTRKSQQNRY